MTTLTSFLQLTVFLQLIVGVRLLGLAVLRDDEEEDEEDNEEDAEGEGEGEGVAQSGSLRSPEQPAASTQSQSRVRANLIQSAMTPPSVRVSVFTPRSPSEAARRESQGTGDEREGGLRRRVRVRQGARSRSPPSSVV